MKRPIEELLNDVLAEATPAEFRTALLAKTMRSARRRKRVRQWSSAAGVMLVLTLGALVFWRPQEVRLEPGQNQRQDLAVEHPQPHGSVPVVTTQTGGCKMIASSGALLTQIETRPSERLYREIDDQQLLTLMSGRPAALVHHSPNQAELILLAGNGTRLN